MIKAIFFDASETLIHLPLGVAHHYRLILARHGIDLDAARLAAAFRSAWKGRPARAATVGPRIDDDRGWWSDLVVEVLSQCGVVIAEPAFDALFLELYTHFTLPGVWELYPDVLPALETLQSRLALGVISNFDQRLHAILAHLQIAPFFRTVVLSSETGADKPDPQIFRRALENLHVEPGEALHIGDDPVLDWQGAEQAGLHYFPLRRPVNSLRDLPAFLEAMNQSGS